MKRILFLFLIASPAFAQWTVYDPANYIVNLTIQTDQQANQAETMRQWTSSLAYLAQQLEQLKAQSASQQQINVVMGQPAAAGIQVDLSAFGVATLTASYGENSSALRTAANGQQSLGYTGDGIYQPLVDQTALGQHFSRQSSLYQRYGAVEQQADNLDTVYAQTGTRLVALGADLADTLQKLKAAPTQAEVEKYSAKIAALNGQILAAEAQRRDAAAQLQAQHALNENQAAKEKQDLLEKQVADEGQAIKAANAWQGGIVLTPTSYTTP